MRGMKLLCALLLAALLTCACLPASLADENDSGLEIIYDDVPAEPEDESGDVDAPVADAGIEDMADTGLVPDDGEYDDAGDIADDDAGIDPLALLMPEEQIACPDVELDGDEAAERYIDQAMRPRPARGRFMLRAAYASAGQARLTGLDLKVYNALKPMIQAVATGDRHDTRFEIPINTLFDQESYTAADLGVDSLYDANGKFTAEGYAAALNFIHINIDNVLSALLADCPYELYWYDKTVGICWLGVGAEPVSQGIRIANYASGTAYFHFAVAKAYSATNEKGTYATGSKPESVAQAAANAQKVISDNASLGDLEKLAAYKKYICDAVSYNRDATAAGTPYGDPWQLVYVFDGDPNTNVVCEGYAKAFQFLCDGSNFINSKVQGVLSVTGNMKSTSGNGGLHMWNLVNIDGINYLADLTNCDEGMAGHPDQLFLVGYTNRDSLGNYSFVAGSRTITYTFDTFITNLFSAEDLKYSGDAVGPAGSTHTLDGITWKLSGNGRILYIMGSGAIPDFTEASPAPWAGSNLTHVCIADGVTGIGAGAFVNCPNLTQVTVPNSLTQFADDAFDPHPVMREKCKGLIIESCSNKEAIAYCNRVSINHEILHGETVNVQAVDPTCTQPGHTHGSYCSVCGFVYEEQQPVAALDHSTVADAAVAATCTHAGKTAGSHCGRCGMVLVTQKTIPAKGHSAKTVKGYAATCTSAGLTDGSRCSVCNTWITPQKTISAKGHSPRTVAGYAATCTSVGLTNGSKCATCGAILTAQKAIPAKGHSPQTVAGYAATCTAAGLTNGSKCSTCGAILTAQKAIPAKGHSPQTVAGYAATCTTAGLTNGSKCATCGAILTAQRAIPAKGHTPRTVPGYPATYFADGLTDASVCATCGAVLTPHQVIPRIPIRLIGLDRTGGNGTVVMSVGEQALVVNNFAAAKGATVTGVASAKGQLVSADASGILTAHREGKAKITVTTNNKKVKATITVQVVDPYKPTGISIANGKTATLAIGQSLRLSPSLAPASARATLTWKSSKPKVATVDASGLVIPQGEGKATITVTTHNKKKATIKVTVVDPYKPMGISIAQGKAVTLAVGQQLRLSPALNPTTAQSALTWKSAKPAVAAVDAGGLVTALKKGKARITVTTYNRKKATITVNVVG